MPKNSSAIVLVISPGLAVADQDAVDRADGRDLGGGAGEEDFVGDVEQFARQGCSVTVRPRWRAMVSTLSRVMPESAELASGGV